MNHPGRDYQKEVVEFSLNPLKSSMHTTLRYIIEHDISSQTNKKSVENLSKCLHQLNILYLYYLEIIIGP